MIKRNRTKFLAEILWFSLLAFAVSALFANDIFGQETPHPSGLCEYQWVFQPDLLPDLNDPKFYRETIPFGGFEYEYYINKKTKKVKVVIAIATNRITGEQSKNWTWQDGDLLVSTSPKLKWNFCIIKMKMHKGKILDLTGFRQVMVDLIKKEKEK